MVSCRFSHQSIKQLGFHPGSHPWEPEIDMGTTVCLAKNGEPQGTRFPRTVFFVFFQMISTSMETPNAIVRILRFFSLAALDFLFTPGLFDWGCTSLVADFITPGTPLMNQHVVNRPGG